MEQSLSENLKATREARGLSLADVAHATRVPIPRLIQLEEGNYAAFGSMAYARGFVRIYSQHLGVDAEGFISGLPEPILGGSADYRYLTESFGPWINERSSRTPVHMHRQAAASPAMTAMLLTVVLGAGLAVFASYNGRGSDSTALARVADRPLMSAKSQPEPPTLSKPMATSAYAGAAIEKIKRAELASSEATPSQAQLRRAIPVSLTGKDTGDASPMPQ